MSLKVTDSGPPIVAVDGCTMGGPLSVTLSVNSVINEFQKGKDCGDESFIIPTGLFEIAKSVIFVEIHYCELNEIKLKHFLKKVHKFTNNSFRMVITWKTRNMQSLFPC